MVELEIDGQKVEVQEGSMVMDAASRLGLYVPHFCYHKKLSIAANCRMCLVEVEKAPKPLPACATPVTAGMKVFTRSEKARQAQKSVMEFLLINHPLDCPICDQGGECQLQDLAVGYGPSASRYTEEKRVVFHKSMGPLISAEEMSRCIHCTRCVRFGQEIAGLMELGMAGRGEHSEIMSFVGGAVQSELSGNMIDICPVGALTSKPFRYSARTWELSRKRSVSPHDSIGANIVMQTKGNEVKRVVPLENEAVNECWISDRDRFGYEGIHSEHRLLIPMVRDANRQWHEASWEDALARAAQILKAAASQGPNRVKTLVSPNSTIEELFLSASLTRALQSDSVDFRPRLGDADFDRHRQGAPNLGMPLAQINQLERIVMIGSFARADHPLLTQRIRQAVRHGAKVITLGAVADELLMPCAERIIASPLSWHELILGIAQAFAKKSSQKLDVDVGKGAVTEQAERVAGLLASVSGPQKTLIMLGNSVLSHPNASLIWANAQILARIAGARIGFGVEGANGVGGYLARAVPSADGANSARMFDDPSGAYLLVNVEPAMDCANPLQARSALERSDGVVALTSFKDSTMEFASVVLPIGTFAETSGTYVNCEGRLQVTEAVIRAQGQSRPAWKVLRVLGNSVGAGGFEFESSLEVRQSVLGNAVSGEVLGDLAFSCSAEPSAKGGLVPSEKSSLIRIADVPIYRSDGLVRHARALSETQASAAPMARMNPADVKRLGLASPGKIRVSQAKGVSVVIDLASDSSVAVGALWLSSTFGPLSELGPMIGPVDVEPA